MDRFTRIDRRISVEETFSMGRRRNSTRGSSPGSRSDSSVAKKYLWLF